MSGTHWLSAPSVLLSVRRQLLLPLCDIPSPPPHRCAHRLNGRVKVLGETCSGKSTLVESLFGETFEDADQNAGHGHPSKFKVLPPLARAAPFLPRGARPDSHRVTLPQAVPAYPPRGGTHKETAAGRPPSLPLFSDTPLARLALVLFRPLFVLSRLSSWPRLPPPSYFVGLLQVYGSARSGRSSRKVRSK